MKKVKRKKPVKKQNEKQINAIGKLLDVISREEDCCEHNAAVIVIATLAGSLAGVDRKQTKSFLRQLNKDL